MKHLFLSLLCLIFSFHLTAQDNRPQASKAEEMAKHITDQMKQVLELTQDQYVAIYLINLATTKDMQKNFNVARRAGVERQRDAVDTLRDRRRRFRQKNAENPGVVIDLRDDLNDSSSSYGRSDAIRPGNRRDNSSSYRRSDRNRPGSRRDSSSPYRRSDRNRPDTPRDSSDGPEKDSGDLVRGNIRQVIHSRDSLYRMVLSEDQFNTWKAHERKQREQRFRMHRNSQQQTFSEMDFDEF